jgi:hypothetical protein
MDSTRSFPSQAFGALGSRGARRRRDIFEPAARPPLRCAPGPTPVEGSAHRAESAFLRPRQHARPPASDGTARRAGRPTCIPAAASAVLAAALLPRRHVDVAEALRPWRSAEVERLRVPGERRPCLARCGVDRGAEVDRCRPGIADILARRDVHVLAALGVGVGMLGAKVDPLLVGSRCLNSSDSRTSCPNCGRSKRATRSSVVARAPAKNGAPKTIGNSPSQSPG